MLLRYLGRPRRMGDLAHIRMCDPSSITNLVARLEGAGLIARQADPADQRARLVTLTAAGEQVRADFVRRLSTGTTGLAGLSDSDLQALRRASRRLG
jgi:DNA-binding MarR family transcriptional regulator